jgi:hypothetical protein
MPLECRHKLGVYAKLMGFLPRLIRRFGRTFSGGFIGFVKHIADRIAEWMPTGNGSA